ncbi:MAG: hypothetical protein R3F43_17535 [bacterium]
MGEAARRASEHALSVQRAGAVAGRRRRASGPLRSASAAHPGGLPGTPACPTSIRARCPCSTRPAACTWPPARRSPAFTRDVVL